MRARHNHRTVQNQAVIQRNAGRLRSHSRPIQSRKQPIPASITRKHPARAISPVSRRSQAHDHSLGIEIPKDRHRPSPIFLIRKRFPFLDRHPLAPLDQPGAEAAFDNLLIQQLNWVHNLARIAVYTV